VKLITSGSAAEAGKRVEQETPDAIVLDVHHIDATGLETYQRLHKVDARIPIILITGHYISLQST